LFQWGKNIVGLLAGKHLIVDGKQLRGTRSKPSKQANVQIVSVEVLPANLRKIHFSN
jgi:hypothetical protein